MTIPPSEASTTQLMCARHLYYLAKQNIESQQAIRLFAGINLLHDAVEVLLWAIAQSRSIGRDRSEIMQLYDDVSRSLAPQQLSFRPAVVQLNRLRVNSKHYGICPDKKEASRSLIRMAEFLRETTEAAFDTNFLTVSLLDLLDDEEIKVALRNAQTNFDHEKYWDCLIDCRKVIYILFESWYNIEKFLHNHVATGLIGIMGLSKASFYKRDPEWIKANTNDPFDYIQLDHENIDKELLKIGIDNATFWNVWRGTPQIYQYDDSKEWLVKRDLRIQAGATEDHTSYILEQTIEVALRFEDSRRRVRWMRGNGSFVVSLRPGGTKIYQKADLESPVVTVTEAALDKITVTEETVGFNNRGTFWKVSHSLSGGTLLGGIFYYGYISNEDVDWSEDERGK